MSDKYKQCSLVFILLCFVCACSNEPKLCSKRAIVTRDVYETYLRTYVATKTRRCWYGARECTYTKRQMTIDGRMVPPSLRKKKKKTIDTIPVCCDGYIEIDALETPCEPVCIPLCKNGVCSKPGECSCHEGYVPDTATKHACLPVCTKECGHGVCTQPNYCTCSFGYAYQNQTCVPICDESCLNGTCVAPGSCECWPGYRKSESNNCKPYCSRGCVHGLCVSPEICACDEGYQQEEMGKCTPICNPTCGNGTCIAPDVCECFAGYNLTMNTTCEPYCSEDQEHAICVAPETYVCENGYRRELDKCTPRCVNECGNGTCIAPDVCECFTGYNLTQNATCEPYCSQDQEHAICVAPETYVCENGYRRELDKCTPHCVNACGNGTCVAPNVCECFAGYKINQTYLINSGNGGCIPECKHCEGSCVSPNTCVCDPPYEVMKTTFVGEMCCDNCPLSHQCEYIMCRFLTTTKKTTTSKDRKVSFTGSYGNTAPVSVTPNLSDIDGVSSTEVKYNTSDNNYENTYNERVSGWNNSEYDVNENVTTEIQIWGADLKSDNQLSSFTFWIIGPVLCLILILLTIIFFIKKKSISHYFKGGSYVVEDNVSGDVCQSKPLPEYQYSTMLHKLEREFHAE